MRSWSVVAFSLLFSFLQMRAQINDPATLRGTITDSLTGEAIPFLNVQVYRGTESFSNATTDFDGNYRINNLAPGKYKVRAAYIGYITKTFDIVLKSGELRRFDIRLAAAQIQLSEDPISYQEPLRNPDVRKVDPEDGISPGRNHRDTSVAWIDGERISENKIDKPLNGTIRGIISDRKSGETIPFAIVSMKGLHFAVSTDVNGFYRFMNLPPGSYHLVINEAHYIPLDTLIHIDPAQIISRNLFLIPIGDSTINSRQPYNTIDPKDIIRIPVIGDSPDYGMGPFPRPAYHWWQWRKKHRWKKSIKKYLAE